MKWLVDSKTAVRRSRARIPEPRVSSTLMHLPSAGTITLPGEHGLKVLTEAARQFEANGYDPAGVVTKCAGDLQSEAARSKYLTGETAR